MEDAVVIAHLSEGLDPGKGGGEEAAFSLEGLQNEGGHLVGGGALLKDILEALEAGGENFLLRQTVGTTVKVGELGPVNPGGQRPQTGGIGFLGGQGHGEQGAAVESPGEGDEIGPPGVGPGDLDSVLIGFGAGVGEEHFLGRPPHWGQLGQLFRQGHVALVGDDVEHAVKVLFRLGLDRVDDLRVGVADVQHADAADPVQKAVAVQVLQHGALAPGDGHGVDTADGGGHGLGAAVNQGLGLGAGQGVGDDFGQGGTQHGNPILSGSKWCGGFSRGSGKWRKSAPGRGGQSCFEAGAADLPGRSR